MVTLSNDCQSHYNIKLNRCLILTTRISNFGKEISTVINLYDANERRDYGYYQWTTQKGKQPLSCQSVPTYGQMKYCSSEEEFNAFVAEYMSQ
jgi:hypothetical protein